MLVNITPNLTEEFWNELVAPFEKANPNIDVKIQPPAESVAKTLPTLLASGDVPDVVETLTPTAELAPELVDLSQYDWAKNGPLADQYAMDGKILTAGVGFQLQGLGLLQQAGVQGCRHRCAARDDGGVRGRPQEAQGRGLDADPDRRRVDDHSSRCSTPAIPTVIGDEPDWYHGISSGDLTWSDTYRDAVERYASWVKDGYIPADSVGVKYPDAEASFLAGKAAMYPMGSWFAAAEAKATDKPEIGVFAAPAEEGTTAGADREPGRPVRHHEGVQAPGRGREARRVPRDRQGRRDRAAQDRRQLPRRLRVRDHRPR